MKDLHGHANLWYLRALSETVKTGEQVVARGKRTWEHLHVRTQLPDPRKRVLTTVYRRANPFFQAAETVWILAGRSDAQWITHYNAQLRQFLDPVTKSVGGGWAGYDDVVTGEHEHFHGAYGERLRRWGDHSKSRLNLSPAQYPVGRDQLHAVWKQLAEDPGSRRAVAVLHNPALDHPSVETKDRPCNIAMSYQLRGSAIHAATFNRSNDLNLGLAYTNIVQFTTIQEFIASLLGADVGTYTHFSSSLHVYEDDHIVKRLLEMPQHMELRPVPFDVYDWVAPTAMARVSWDEAETVLALLLHPAAQPSSIRCPYWSSIRAMLCAWTWLKDHTTTPGVALECADGFIREMQTGDWQVACLEFVHRWACKRKVEGQFHLLLRGYNYPAEVFSYITHDNGDTTDAVHP